MTAPAGIYIHVPFCAVKCPYCDFYSVRYHKQSAADFADAVCRNLRALPRDLCADTLYFGGGTPSLLSGTQLRAIVQTAREHCALSEDAEITLEANPLTVTDSALTAWRRAGINRLSLGVQSFQSEVLRQLGRRHTPQQAGAAVLRANAAGFVNLSVDLMVGLAEQTSACFAADLETAVSLPVTHISAYLLKIEEHTPFYDSPPAMLDADSQADRWLQMHQALTDCGFLHYEISNFAKPGCESRHNCKYWRLHPYYGIGPAAHSCHGGKRYAVPRDLAGFCGAPRQEETVTEPEACGTAEQIMLGLRLSEGVLLSDFPEEQAQILRRAGPLIPQFLTLQNGRLSMTPEGWLVSNSVIVRLLQ
ncbi:MAG: radical SAM family heme chaperone HemW [Oscillospiraceae bacterium]|nr:radical SAM family heme chaperone HemW [Oscillospiraceae bacterium]